MTLLGADAFDLAPANAVEIQLRATTGDHVHSSSAVVLLFARCSRVVGVETSDEGILGKREAAVRCATLDDRAAHVVLQGVDPYDRRLDGLVSLERDRLV